MSKFVAGLFMTLDGVVETPEQWSFPYFNEEVGQELASTMADTETLVLGRVTYETFAASWGRQAPSEDPMAQWMNAIPKLVASTTLDAVEWQNSRLIEGDVIEALAELKQQQNLFVNGSVTLVRSLLAAHLLDELRLLVHPIAVGGGRRLLDATAARVPLTLVDARPFKTGVLSLTYTPDGAS